MGLLLAAVAADKFFSKTLDNSEAEAYTGRLK